MNGSRHLLSPADEQADRREIPVLDPGKVEHRPDHRRRHPQGAHVRPLDLVDHHFGVEGAVDDGRGAHRDQGGRGEIERSDMVEGTAGQSDVGTGQTEFGDVGVVLPRQIGVCDHHPLGSPGGPRGVHQTMDVVTMGGGAGRGRGPAIQVGEELPTFDARGRHADAEDIVQRGRGLIRELEEFVVADHGDGLGVLEDELQLGGGQPPIERHDDGPEVARRRRSSS